MTKIMGSLERGEIKEIGSLQRTTSAPVVHNIERVNDNLGLLKE